MYTKHVKLKKKLTPINSAAILGPVYIMYMEGGCPG